MIRTSSEGIGGRICKIKVFVGDNYACTRLPAPKKTDYDNVVFNLDPTVSTGCTEPHANVTFKALTNWGRGPIVPDFTPDPDAIVIDVFYTPCPSVTGDLTLEASLGVNGSTPTPSITNVVTVQGSAVMARRNII
jgi:hypothetical protein